MILNICVAYNSTEEIDNVENKIFELKLNEENQEDIVIDKDINLSSKINSKSMLNNKKDFKKEYYEQDLFEKNLYTNKDLSVDMLIRTSGELRLSNFLLYQCRFSIIYFMEKNWPELNYLDFIKMLIYYNIQFPSHIKNLQELSSSNNFRINQLRNYS